MFVGLNFFLHISTELNKKKKKKKKKQAQKQKPAEYNRNLQYTFHQLALSLNVRFKVIWKANIVEFLD